MHRRPAALQPAAAPGGFADAAQRVEVRHELPEAERVLGANRDELEPGRGAGGEAGAGVVPRVVDGDGFVGRGGLDAGELEGLAVEREEDDEAGFRGECRDHGVAGGVLLEEGGEDRGEVGDVSDGAKVRGELGPEGECFLGLVRAVHVAVAEDADVGDDGREDLDVLPQGQLLERLHQEPPALPQQAHAQEEHALRVGLGDQREEELRHELCPRLGQLVREGDFLGLEAVDVVDVGEDVVAALDGQPQGHALVVAKLPAHQELVHWPQR
mmetsp:Transcript_3712/g.9397  ORF Transcript_3712/g.9397 Transcript_3712/m.9397 type:complete len:270 (-) Transcript_3712:156-965(-)